MTDLGAIYPMTLNDTDVVAGFDTNSRDGRVWSKGSLTTLPGTLYGVDAEDEGSTEPSAGSTNGHINAAGVIVLPELSSATSAWATQIWTPTKGKYPTAGVGYESGSASTWVSGINSAGDLGLTTNSAANYITSGDYFGYVTGPKGAKPQQITDSRGSVGISDVNHVDNYTPFGGSPDYRVAPLPTKADPKPAETPLNSTADAVAMNGVIAGTDSAGDLVVRAANGKLTDGPVMTPVSVNDAGDVVGYDASNVQVLVRAGAKTATPITSLIPPGALVDLVYDVGAINDNGDIVLWGRNDRTATSEGFMLSAPRLAAPVVSVKTRTLKRHAKRVLVPLRCASATCTGRVTLSASKSLGSAKYKLHAGKSGVVSVPLNHAGTKKLKHASKKHPVHVKIAVTVAGGVTRHASATIS